MAKPYEPKKLTPNDLAELHALPDDALATAQAAAFLRLRYSTLSWYRCNGGGPNYTRIGPKLIRSRMGDLRDNRRAGRRAVLPRTRSVRGPRDQA